MRPYFSRSLCIVDSWSTDSEPFEWWQAYLTLKNNSKILPAPFLFHLTLLRETSIDYTSSFSHRLQPIIVDTHDHNRNRSSMSTRWVNSSTRSLWLCKSNLSVHFLAKKVGSSRQLLEVTNCVIQLKTLIILERISRDRFSRRLVSVQVQERW